MPIIGSMRLARIRSTTCRHTSSRRLTKPSGPVRSGINEEDRLLSLATSQGCYNIAMQTHNLTWLQAAISNVMVMTWLWRDCHGLLYSVTTVVWCQGCHVTKNPATCSQITRLVFSSKGRILFRLEKAGNCFVGFSWDLSPFFSLTWKRSIGMNLRVMKKTCKNHQNIHSNSLQFSAGCEPTHLDVEVVCILVEVPHRWVVAVWQPVPGHPVPLATIPSSLGHQPSDQRRRADVELEPLIGCRCT